MASQFFQKLFQVDFSIVFSLLQLLITTTLFFSCFLNFLCTVPVELLFLYHVRVNFFFLYFNFSLSIGSKDLCDYERQLWTE